MKTIVLQSFRTSDVPGWLDRCMHSVMEWTQKKGWDYEYLDDRFFKLAPEWVHIQCRGNIYALTDVCRLQWALNCLYSGYERVVWVDADVLVFASDRLDINTRSGAAFAHELYLNCEPEGGITSIHGMNNALMVFENRQSILEYYFESALDALQQLPPGQVPRTALGPSLLQKLSSNEALEKIFGVGLFTYSMMREIVAGDGPLLRQCIQLSPAPLGAANLCHFLRNKTPLSDRLYFDALYDRAVDHLLDVGMDFE